MTRPDHLVLVAGTATEVGKTWVSCRLADALVTSGTTVAARKAAQSFEPDDPTTDAVELAAATRADPHEVCPAHRWYPVPMAPPMAAEALHLPPFELAHVLDELRWPDPAVAVGLFETAGGVASPQTTDADVVGVAEALSPDLVLLVADPGLGTISNVRLCCDALGLLDAPVMVFLNRFDAGVDLHVRNHSWLVDRDGYDVVTSLAELIPRFSPAQ